MMTKSILTTEGYWARYYQLLQDGSSNKDAWAQLEDELREQFGTSKYSSYESFRVMKTKYLQSLKG